MSSVRRPKKYKCTQPGCDKAYSRPCLLEQHERSHSDIRPFVCDACGKGFFRDSHLQSHRWTHAKEKPLGCDKCHKRFITNQQLQRHAKTHLKTSPPLRTEAKLYIPVESSEAEDTLETESPVDDVWKLHLDKMTKDIDSLVHDSPMDQVPSLDMSSFSLQPVSPDYTYTPEVDAEKFQSCPYSCPSVFRTTADLSLHMLESHILSEQFASAFSTHSPLSTPPFEAKMSWDKVEFAQDYAAFDTFVTDFLRDPHHEYEDSPEYKPMGVPHMGDHGAPEMRYQRTFGSEGHRVTTRVESVEIAGVEEFLDMGEIRRHMEKRKIVELVVDAFISWKIEEAVLK